MDRLSLFLAAALVFGIDAAVADDRRPVADLALNRWHDVIAETRSRFPIPEGWVRAVMRVESGGIASINGHPIISRAGAIGPMQIMPETYAELRTRYGLGPDPADPHDNIVAGIAYLWELYQRYGYPNLFAAYNAGPRRFDDHLLFGRPLPHETSAYLGALGHPSFDAPVTGFRSAGNGLFFAIGVPLRSEPPSPASGGLFVPLKTVP